MKKKRKNIIKRIMGRRNIPRIEEGEAKKLLTMLDNTRVDEYACDDAFEVLGIYTELEAKGGDTGKLMPLVKHHLSMCTNCREEFEALLKILKSDNDKNDDPKPTA